MVAVVIATAVVLAASVRPVAAVAATASLTVEPAPAPAYDRDAPDPDIVLGGSDYYAFTTGTDFGNHLQALVDTSGSPESGWQPYTGGYGSSALPVVPAWQEVNTQTSPGVFYWGGRWLMYYDAATVGHAGDTGFNCLSVATAATLTPDDPVFTDSSTGPLVCQSSLGGDIDPSPFVDPATGRAYLQWKSNSGGSDQPARIWSQQLSANGLSLVGSPSQLLVQNSGEFPWETTIENPDMVVAGSTYFLMFSTGIWDSPSYSEAFATCSGPIGPCYAVGSALPHLLRVRLRSRWRITVPGRLRGVDAGLRRLAAGMHQLRLRRGPTSVRGPGHPRADLAPRSGHRHGIAARR